MAKNKYIYQINVDFNLNDDFIVSADNVAEAKQKALERFKKKYRLSAK